METQTQSVRKQFHLLLDRANKRFGKLRELQARGDHAWSVVQPYFNKAFDAFSKLWEFQIHNRPALMETGLLRSDLGSIASKIGQLYYNYYLRSGDPSALLESYTFYDAIQTRQYFASTVGQADPAATARQLRFFARFLVVCLLLNRHEEAMQLMQELQACVSSYALQFSPPDAADWQLVLGEVGAMLAAHVATPLPRSPASVEAPFRPQLRCSPAGPIANTPPHRSRLREAILVSYRPRQVKVAELPLELYRMAQALEWQDARLGPGGAAAPVAAEAGQQGRETRVEADQAQSSAGLTADSGAAGSGACTRGGEQQGVGPVPSGCADHSGSSAGREGGGASDPRPRDPCARQEPGPAPGSSCGQLRTPPRQLLHRPTAQQLLSALLAVTEAVAAPEEEFVLLYIAADASSAGRQPTAAGPRQAPEDGGDDAAASGKACGQSGAEQRPAAGSALEGARPERQLLLCPASHQAHQRTALRRPAGADRLPAAGPSSGSGAGGQGAAGGSSASAAPAASTASTSAAPGPGPGPGCSPDCLLSPEELLVGTRRRVLLVLDSDMSRDFARLQGQERCYPLLCLMSPAAPPAAPAADPSRTGSLTTLALACPAQALCALLGQLDPPPELLQRLQAVLDDELSRLASRMARQLGVPAPVDGYASVEPQAGPGGGSGCCSAGSGRGEGHAAWCLVFQDVLARRLLLHFAFYRCCMAMYTHGWRGGEEGVPSCFPPLPPAADAHDEALQAAVLRAAAVLGGQGAFGASKSPIP